jgi:hypothetical protein
VDGEAAQVLRDHIEKLKASITNLDDQMAPSRSGVVLLHTYCVLLLLVSSLSADPPNSEVPHSPQVLSLLQAEHPMDWLGGAPENTKPYDMVGNTCGILQTQVPRAR